MRKGTPTPRSLIVRGATPLQPACTRAPVRVEFRRSKGRPGRCRTRGVVPPRLPGGVPTPSPQPLHEEGDPCPRVPKGKGGLPPLRICRQGPDPVFFSRSGFPGKNPAAMDAGPFSNHLPGTPTLSGTFPGARPGRSCPVQGPFSNCGEEIMIEMHDPAPSGQRPAAGTPLTNGFAEGYPGMHERGGYREK